MESLNKNFLKWFLIFLLGAFLINLGTLVLFHEEPRRGIIAFEMLKRGDFLQPTVLGEPYFKKPPFHNWVLIATSSIFGSISEFSLRLPSALSTVLTSVLIFLFGKSLLGQRQALLAALIYPTFFVVLIGYSTKCEPDTLLTLLITAATLSWLFFIKREKRFAAWFLGYLFTSLALLTKGLPAVQFFGAFVLAYLLVEKRWRELFRWEHLLAFPIALVPFGAWLLAVDTQLALKALFGEVLSRAPGKTPASKMVKHYASYPFRFLTATLPWSALFLFYLVKRRVSLVLRSETEKVLALALLIDFLIYWLFPGTRLRYLMPALPLLALLLGSLLAEVEIVHKRAKEAVRFFSQVVVLAGIVSALLVSKNPSLTLKATVTFLLFFYAVYFLFLPRFFITSVVALWAVIMLIIRGFYSSYYYPIAQYKYPPVREVAAQIVSDSSGFKLYTKTKYLQLCFYVERGRDEILRFTEKPPKEALFLSQRSEGNVLREYKLGKRVFYLCSYSVKSLPERKQSEEEQKRQRSERQSRSKEREESLRG